MDKNSIHPGHILQTFYLNKQGMSIKKLAELVKMPRSFISGFIKGKHSVTPELSLKLSEVFSTTPDLWFQLQLNFDTLQAEKRRGTDDPFYTLMTIIGPAMLKFIGVKSPEGYQSRAIVLKEKRLYPDIVAFPKDKDKEVVMIEFQGYKEPMMRYIMSSKISMLCTAEQYTGPMLGVIVYTDKKFKDAALPFSITSLSGDYYVKGKFVEIVLSEWTEEKLLAIDEQLIILAPFTLPKNYPKEEFKKKCRKWKKFIDKTYPENIVKEILNIMSLFILNRQRQFSNKEVKKMFNFDISETKVGQELLEEGEKIGKKEGKKGVISIIFNDRFGKMPVKIKRQFKRINDDKLLNDLARSIYKFNDMDDFHLWWKDHYSAPPSKCLRGLST